MGFKLLLNKYRNYFFKGKFLIEISLGTIFFKGKFLIDFSCVNNIVINLGLECHCYSSPPLIRSGYEISTGLSAPVKISSDMSIS